MEEIGNDLLSEIHIETFALTRDKRVIIIRSIYEKFLQDDDLWHFFYEEEQGDIIRCSPDNAPKIAEFLDECGFKYRYNKLWLESVPEVVNNPEYFAEIFHINSTFLINNAIKFKVGSKKGSMVSLIDRYSHSLYINEGFVSGNTDFSEGAALAEAALNRSFYEGMRFQYLRDKPYLDKLREKSDGNQD